MRSVALSTAAVRTARHATSVAVSVSSRRLPYTRVPRPP